MRTRSCLMLGALLFSMTQLGGCDSIRDPDVRPASFLPSGPVNKYSVVSEAPCPDGSFAGSNGVCPPEQSTPKEQKEAVARETLAIHARGG